jgi:hypothetical protein
MKRACANSATFTHAAWLASDSNWKWMRCLAKSPDDRFADAPALEKALAACRCAEGWSEQQAANWWRAHCDSDPPATSHHVAHP